MMSDIAFTARSIVRLNLSPKDHNLEVSTYDFIWTLALEHERQWIADLENQRQLVDTALQERGGSKSIQFDKYLVLT
jgi:hypothetical protein